ncbi:MAG: dTDP-4-amino-4,6-dideoxygalactose transaminase [Candidatus Thermoplasmatota archaeon]|nr:dTDP-4-amino-4,6-dideoxygalactose transaminase [Candidatus Thermoplasmatota archaeon]
MIKFNEPTVTGEEIKNINDVIERAKFSGDGYYSQKSSDLMKKLTGSAGVYLVPSGTHALEMATLLSDIRKGDEIIMPSFTFSSTANAFILRGAKIRFIDIRPDTLNMNEELIEDAVTERTKAIVPVHYAGVSCEMDKIINLAKSYGLLVIEDAAQGILASFNGKPLGSIGDFGCLSFHETKNAQCGEGGALLVNDNKNISFADILMEKGTDRKQYIRGEIDKYTWRNIGSSFLINELTAAFLYAQLSNIHEIIKHRLQLWNMYLENLSDVDGLVAPKVPSNCQHNGHIFHIRLKDSVTRNKLQKYLSEKGIQTATHYVPLHSSPYGSKIATFVGEDQFTTVESSRLLRLPLHNKLNEQDIIHISGKIKDFVKSNA